MGAFQLTTLVCYAAEIERVFDSRDEAARLALIDDEHRLSR